MLSQLAVLAVLFASGDCFRASTDLKDQECQESQTNPEYFSELRSNAFITECSKKDVCLLMRQLDAYFYARALKGELVDYGKPPGGRFLASGNCKRPLNSKKLVPVTTKEECQKILSKHTKKKMKVIHSTKYPAGCIMDFVTKRGRFQQSRLQRRRRGQVHSGWQISHFCTAKEDGRPAVSWYILNILKLS